MRYGNLLIEGKVTTQGSAVDAVNADDLLFELGSATTGNANGGSISFKPGAGIGSGTSGSVEIQPFAPGAGSTSTLMFMDLAGHHVGFKAADSVTNTTWTLPTADGMTGQVLKTDGSGALSWQSIDTTAYINLAGDTGTASASLLNDTISFVGGTGISTVAADATPDTVTFSIDYTKLGTAKTAPVGGDSFLLFDSTASNAPVSTTISDLVTSLNLVTSTSNGILVQTAANTFTSRSIDASVAAGKEGINVVDGDGIGGNPTVGLDIAGLTAATDPVASTVELAAFDGANNVKVTPSQIVTSRIVRGTFANASLTAGALAIAHNLDVATVLVQIFDESNQMVLPDTTTLTNVNTTTVDLTSYGTLSGTWSYIIFG